MKPLSLKFKCFGPFMDEQYIDFENISGLFLIAGNTGAGKTTILDAMCIALFNEASGGVRGDIASMRCKLADITDVTYVEYIFEVDGVRYKFYRDAKVARKNLNDTHNCMRFEDGEYVPMMSNPTKRTVNEMAQKILQLSADQFRQIIILPQGQFEKLLVSSSSEKEEILTQVFHAERFGKIVDIIKGKVKEKSDALAVLHNSIQISLNNEGVESIEALNEKLGIIEETLGKLKEDKSVAEKRKKETVAAYESALEENKDFEAVDKAQKTFDLLSAKEMHMGQERDSVNKAKKADSIREIYTEKERSKVVLIEARKSYEENQKKFIVCKDEETETINRLEKHKENEVFISNIRRNMTLMENARGTYETLDEKRKAYNDAKQIEDNAKINAESLSEAYEKAEKLYNEVCEQRNECMRKLQESTVIYNRGAAARLGKKLIKDGGPCPVCGSLIHPSIAHTNELDIEITDSDLSRLNNELGEATKKVADAENERNNKKNDSITADNEYKTAMSDKTGRQAEYESARKNLIDGIDSLEKLENEIKKAANDIAEYEETMQKLTDEKEKASLAVNAIETQLKDSLEILKKAEKDEEQVTLVWIQKLQKTEFLNEAEYESFLWDKKELNIRNEELIGYYKELENAKQTLLKNLESIKDRVKPDINMLKQLKEDADFEDSELSKNLGREENNYNRLKILLGSVSKKYEKYKKDAEHVNKDEEFLNKLLPRSGVSFQRYVLGVMFISVIDAANKLLENVQGGRYRLARTDDTSKGNQSGLELAVFDASNGHYRAVVSLSGGEKFLVALSLAIGLSTVIQAQSHGIRLEAMFIDEGFGSLDEKSIDEAVEVLNTVQAGHGIVGVISHVERLRGILPYCIEVFHGEMGNYIKV